jgi:predicted outer membrane lipoprotein
MRPTRPSLAGVLGWIARLPIACTFRIIDKLTREPVEDFRIDFEDGFGNRPDDEEDRFAQSAAEEVAAAAGGGPAAAGKSASGSSR